MKKYSSEDLDGHYMAKTQAFTDWCNDVAIFYSLRLVLFKLPVIIEVFPQETEPDSPGMISFCLSALVHPYPLNSYFIFIDR